MLKFIKLHIINMCSLLYVHYTSIRYKKGRKDGGREEERERERGREEGKTEKKMVP